MIIIILPTMIGSAKILDYKRRTYMYIKHMIIRISIEKCKLRTDN